MMLGIDSDRMAVLAMFLGSFLAGLAAVALLPSGNIVVEAGYNVLIMAIAVCIVGGLGSWAGAVAGRFSDRLRPDPDRGLPGTPLSDGGGPPGHHHHPDPQTFGALRPPERIGGEGLIMDRRRRPQRTDGPGHQGPDQRHLRHFRREGDRLPAPAPPGPDRGLLLLPLVVTNAYWQRVISIVGIYALLALSFDFLTHYVGLVSLGGAFFVGVGGYMAALLNTKLGLSLSFPFPWPPSVGQPSAPWPSCPACRCGGSIFPSSPSCIPCWPCGSSRP